MIDSVRAVELYARGFGTPVIARMLGASQMGIKAALLRNGVTMRNRSSARLAALAAGSVVDAKGPQHPHWKGGRIKTTLGYILVWLPDHPKAYKTGYVYEHVAVLEAKLGRPLMRGEISHHINGVKDDNRPENLEAVTQSQHRKLHWAELTDAQREERIAKQCAGRMRGSDGRFRK